MHCVDYDEVEVKLGRIGNRKAKRAKTYLRRARWAAKKAGASSHRTSSFSGDGIGRGHAQGTVMAGQGRG